MGDGASSEAALRRLRWEFLRNWQHQTQGLVATGHHAQDFLETRLINLIRGSGPHGLRSMSVFDSERRLLRPLLTLSPSEIAAYAQVQKVEFIDDPSNGTLTPLRNWIRHAWLPALETKRRGATATLARSLELLAQAQESTSKGPVMELRREDFRGLDSTKKAVVIVELFRQRGLKTYTKAQVNEFLKRLDTPRKNFTFSVAGLKWMADAERVIALESDDAGVEFDSR
jgi:tRNA(Ile)-lysidine synthase